MHSVDSLTESSGWASRDTILTKQITIWHECQQQQRTSAWLCWKTEQKHHGFKAPWDTTKSDIIFIQTLFFHSQGIQSYSQHWVISWHRNSSIWYSGIFALKHSFHIEGSSARLEPSCPIDMFDWCKLQTTKCPFWCRPVPGTMSSDLNAETNC